MVQMTLDGEAARNLRAWIDAAHQRLRKIKSLKEENPAYRCWRAQDIFDHALDFRDQALRFSVDRPELYQDFAAECQKIADEARELID
jgi:hypothetical protein